MNVWLLIDTPAKRSETCTVGLLSKVNSTLCTLFQHLVPLVHSNDLVGINCCIRQVFETMTTLSIKPVRRLVVFYTIEQKSYTFTLWLANLLHHLEKGLWTARLNITPPATRYFCNEKS